MHSLPSELSQLKPAENRPMVPHPPRPAAPPASQEGDYRNIVGLLQRRALVILGVASAFIGYSAWDLLNEESLYAGNFQLLVEPVNAENASLAVPNLDGGGSSGRSSLDYATQIAVLKSPELIGEVVAELQPTYPELSYGAVANNLEIQRVGETKILQVSYQSNEASKTQVILDEIARQYLQYSLDERQTYLRQGLQFVDQQLMDLQRQVDQLQNELEQFQQRYSLIDPEGQSSTLVERIAELEQQRNDLRQQIGGVVTRLDTLESGQGLMVGLEQDSVYQQILAEARAIDLQISQELTRFLPTNPRIRLLEQRRANLQPLLDARRAEFLEHRFAEGIIQTETLETELQTAEENLTALQQQMQQTPALTRQYKNIQRRLEINNASLTRFLETRQQLQVEAAQREIPWQLVREASVYTIGAGNLTNQLITKVLMGLALGVGAAFLLDKLDPSYHTVKELQGKVRQPILGVLPFNQQLFLHPSLAGTRRGRKLLSRIRVWLVKTSSRFSKSMSSLALSLLDEYDTSAEFMEALRVLHTNLLVLKQTQQIRSLVVSSAAPGDGKTTLALNWAKTATTLGQRVLLIDASLRSPQLNGILALDNSRGLSTVLQQQLNPMEVVQQVNPR